MIFIPGMRPGLVSGAAGPSGHRRPSEKIVVGSKFRGKVTPRNLVPYEEPRKDVTVAKRARETRAKDVSESFHFHRDSPASAKDKLKEVRASVESVAI